VRVGNYRVRTPTVVLVVFAVVVVGAVVVGGATSATAFGTFNPNWEGTSDLRAIADEAGAESEVVTNTTAYDGYGNDTVAVVLAPDEGYTQAEIARIEAFLERGGTVLVADHTGTGNELLSALGAEARIEGTLLRDDRNYYRDPALPEATNVSTHPLPEDVGSLTLNYGTAVEPGEATVLASSSPFGYLDANGNEQVDDNETLDSYPVATTENVSGGQVLVVGDPSAFINVMAEREGNRRFARNLFGTGDRVLIDASHTGGVPPLVGLLLAIRDSAVAQFGLVGVGLLVVLGWQRGRFERTAEPRIDRQPSTETLAETAAERYPGFDGERLQRLMKGIKSINHENGDDE
jgi:hypothetical protein